MNRAIGLKAAACIQFAAKYATLVVQVLITAVLARLLAPEEFGAVAIVSVFTTFFSIMSDVGIGTAVIQFDTLRQDDYKALFTFSCLLGLALMGAFVAIAHPMSVFYRDSTVESLCVATAPAVFFSTINMVPNGLMLKRKEFASIGTRLIVVTVISGLLAIASATLGLGPYSLVIQSVSSAMFIFIWNYIKMPDKGINLRFMPALRKVYSYSLYQFGFSLINYFNRSLDNLLIGRYLGASALGYYDKAYKLTTYPLSSVSGVISSVLQPYMSEHQNDPDIMYRYFLKIERFISLAAVPIVGVLFCCGSEIITVVYGDGWTPSVVPFQLLSLSLYVQFLGNPTGAFYQSLCKTNLLFAQGLINTLITVIGLMAGLATDSLVGVALGVSFAFCLQAIPMALLTIKGAFHANARDLLVLLPEMLIGTVAVLLTTVFGHFFAGAVPLIRLLLKMVVCLSVILICYKAFGLLGTMKQCLRGGVE